jgi:hypothetical protein
VELLCCGCMLWRVETVEQKRTPFTLRPTCVTMTLCRRAQNAESSGAAFDLPEHLAKELLSKSEELEKRKFELTQPRVSCGDGPRAKLVLSSTFDMARGQRCLSSTLTATITDATCATRVVVCGIAKLSQN